ncbi:MAG: alpha/beta fold hydrolase, partial [Planctomycetia bacterium]|nr:alpha/beta fold hydrolase [Planctomycetia bacterium]
MLRQLLIVLLACVAHSQAWAEPIDQSQAVKLSRRWLDSRDRHERDRLATQLANFHGDWESVLVQLSKRVQAKSATGYLPERHFSVAALRKQHPDDLLYFVVPKKYRPDRPTGLIVFMHGGGATSSRRAPRSYMQFPDAEDGDINSRLGSLFSATGMIAVGPSAPWDESTPLRWCVRDSEEYLSDVILECKATFNIDPDRVFLMGHSMGGFGEYHHIQRSPDRFAGVVVSSGSWSLGYWPTIRGTPLAIFQGAHDARAGVRWHYTDVEYGRWTDKLLKRQDLDHEYFEHNGKHSVGYSKERIAAWFRAAGRLERDPCSPHVTLASPVGFSRTYCFPVRHNRWLTLDEAAASENNGEIKY